jgi:hypothetical protein
MRYGRPTVRWIGLTLGFLSCFAFTVFPKRAAAQSILPSFNKPGVLVSDAAIPSDSTLSPDQTRWSCACFVISDVTKLGISTLPLTSGVLVSDGPVTVDCIVVIESDMAEPRAVCQFRCLSVIPY